MKKADRAGLMKNRYRKTAVLIVLPRIADLLLTRIYTPNLQAEWNPVVSFLGASWPVVSHFEKAIFAQNVDFT